MSENILHEESLVISDPAMNDVIVSEPDPSVDGNTIPKAERVGFEEIKSQLDNNTEIQISEQKKEPEKPAIKVRNNGIWTQRYVD